MGEPSRNHTWLCSVVFVDVVSYTRNLMDGQIAVKEYLDSEIRRYLSECHPDDYILLDRGDGAAICFLVEPETALFFALNLRDAIVNAGEAAPKFEIRTGINLGPVKIVRGVDGEKTTVGAGINCASRIMDFADANQILVSRSFYEVIGCLSEDYARLFSFAGTRADKHVRMFDVYEVKTRSQVGAGNREETPALQCIDLPDRDGSPWSGNTIRILEDELADQVGPIARVLVTQIAQKAGDLDELLLLAAGKLHDSQARPAFIERLRSRIGGMSSGDVPEHKLTASDVKPSGNNEEIPSATRNAARRILADFLGPIASMLVERAAMHCRDPKEFQDLLAAELSKPSEKKAFLQQMYDL